MLQVWVDLHQYELQLWDLAGQEEYEKFRSQVDYTTLHMSNVMKCKMSWNVKDHQMENVDPNSSPILEQRNITARINTVFI